MTQLNTVIHPISPNSPLLEMDSANHIRLHLTSLENLLQSEMKAREDAEKRISDLEAQLSSAHATIDALKKEKADAQPLYQVGRDIRRRFLELAREQVLFEDRKNLSAWTIEEGNGAAHAGDGIADAALVCRIPESIIDGWDWQATPNAEFHSLNEVFESLYHSAPATYLQRTAKNPMLREAIDLQATIRTVKSLNNGVDRPLKEKQSAMDAFELIMKRYNRAMQDGRELTEDEDMEVWRRLKALREFTKVIVEYDRRMKAKEVGKEKPSKTAY